MEQNKNDIHPVGTLKADRFVSISTDIFSQAFYFLFRYNITSRRFISKSYYKIFFSLLYRTQYITVFPVSYRHLRRAVTVQYKNDRCAGRALNRYFMHILYIYIYTYRVRHGVRHIFPGVRGRGTAGSTIAGRSSLVHVARSPRSVNRELSAGRPGETGPIRQFTVAPGPVR